jgi:hypothetical protein
MALSVRLYRVVGKGKDRRSIPIELGRRGRRSKEEFTGPLLWRGKGDVGTRCRKLGVGLFFRQKEPPTPRPSRKSKETPYFQRGLK